MWLEKGEVSLSLLSPLDCVDLLYANATYPFYKNKMGKRSFFLSYKKKKKRTIFFFRNRPSFSKTMDEQTKYERFFVCSSTKNMRTVLLHSILFLQVKSIESSLDDSTKKVVVFGRLLSSKHSLPKINLV
ncbi:hypothetical protein ICE98_00130 [Lactococcus lactis]|nr:hypothetical protein [Lactococcus lactis]